MNVPSPSRQRPSSAEIAVTVHVLQLLDEVSKSDVWNIMRVSLRKYVTRLLLQTNKYTYWLYVFLEIVAMTLLMVDV